MKELTALVWITVAIAVPVCAAVSVACYVTESGWPLIGLVVLSGLRLRFRDDSQSPDD